MFTVDSKTENYLRNLGVQYEYKEEVPFEQFAPDWSSVNLGRPTSQLRIDAAVETYALMMEQGSAAPAVILHRLQNGLHDVLDGIQRSLAADYAGFTKVAAYVVRCTPQMAKKIRIAANLRLQGAAPVDAEWCIKELVQNFMIEGHESARDIAMACGRSVADIEKVHRRMLVANRIDALFDGGKAPRLSAGVLDAIAASSDPSDFELAPKQNRKFVEQIAELNFPNGDATRLVKMVYGFKRSGNTSRIAQFNTRLREFREDAVVQGKLTGKKGPLTKVQSQLAGLKTIAKAYRDSTKKQECRLDDVEHARRLDADFKEAGRLLRESVSTKVLNASPGIFNT